MLFYVQKYSLVWSQGMVLLNSSSLSAISQAVVFKKQQKRNVLREMCNDYYDMKANRFENNK